MLHLVVTPLEHLHRRLDVAGVKSVDSLGYRDCAEASGAVGHRYLALLDSRVGAGPLRLVDRHGGLLEVTPEVRAKVAEGLTRPLPASAWKDGPEGLQTRIALLPPEPSGVGPGEVNLLVLYRNVGAKEVKFAYSSWPLETMSRCNVELVNVATRAKVEPRDVPIAKQDIAAYFPRYGRKFDWSTAPGEQSLFRLPRVTTAEPGWGYKEELGFRYYPAPAGRYTLSVECVNFIAGGALSTGPMELELPLPLPSRK